MREALRRKLPKTRGWYTGLILAILVVIGVIVWLVWGSVLAESPRRTVSAAIDAARGGNLVGLGALLSPESVANPGAEGWLKQLAAALARPGVRITDVEILRKVGSVKVSVPHRGASGGQERTEISVNTVRSDEGWLIDLEATMASQNLQFWMAVAAEQD